MSLEVKIINPDESLIPTLGALWREAFEDSVEFTDMFFSTAYAPERCRCLLCNGELVGALYLFDCECRGRKFAYIYAVATLKKYRGMGICRKLMDDTGRYLQERGVEGAMLVPGSKQLFSFYRKMGYGAIGGVSEIHCEAAEEAAVIRTVSKSEYAALRRKLLPDGGVVQEGVNLDFLEKQAGLYAGDGFVLAARKHGEKLFGTELLGDTGKAGAIVRALGCREGSFIIPGDRRRLAMYRKLTDEQILPPTYFGLAFN